MFDCYLDLYFSMLFEESKGGEKWLTVLGDTGSYNLHLKTYSCYELFQLL